MKVTDYAKLEELKRIITSHLVKLGMEDRVNGILDDDLDKLIKLMGNMNKLLNEKSEDEQITFLINYIIGLWGILVIDYNHSLEVL